jgi:amino acid transporter
MTTIQATRPRDLNYIRAAGLLYGDLGTSKAYVLGLAFALAGHASFWFIFAVSILTLLVGLNYIVICRLYPHGGGVYASVRDRSKILSFVGAFFLISDYLITASLSALSAFHYLGLPYPVLWAMLSIFAIGILNLLGPKQTGSLSILLAIPTIICVLGLGLLSIPFLPEAIQHLDPINHDVQADWNVFVGVIVALSGIEAIATTTGSMKLDRGSSFQMPSVKNTSTPAILIVIFEVCFFTTLFGLAMNALPGLEAINGTVIAPDGHDVRDYMLKYMAEVFGSSFFGAKIGTILGFLVSIVVALILLSAVNTALVGLSSLLFVMSRDGELPLSFQQLNRFGVPIYSLISAFILPIGILFVVDDVAGLANLYAIGFVGAIAVNLGSTSTNPKHPLSTFERSLMFGTFLIMALVEVTLFIDKPEARGFVITIMGIGLLLRALVAEHKEQQKVVADITKKPSLPPLPSQAPSKWMIAVSGSCRALDYAIEEALTHQIPLYILFVREQGVITFEDDEKVWLDDPEACRIYDYIASKQPNSPMEFLYTITPHTAHSVAEIAKEKDVNRLILGGAKRWNQLVHVLRGTTIRDLIKKITPSMEVIVVY